MSSTSRSHIIIVPPFVLALRVFQLVVAIVILGLAAYGVTFLSFDGDSLSLFTALATIIITVYILVASIAFPIAYNYWAILGLEIFAIIFWLVSFALLASEVAKYSVVTYYGDYCTYINGYCYKNRVLGLEKRASTSSYTYRNAMAAASGLGGLEFLLFIITLVIFSLRLQRHRAEGGHCLPNSSAPATTEPKPVELQQPHNGQYTEQYAPQQEQEIAMP